MSKKMVFAVFRIQRHRESDPHPFQVEQIEEDFPDTPDEVPGTRSGDQDETKSHYDRLVADWEREEMERREASWGGN
jgi:hypothetical protein